ncbi:AraC family transcriptional regulator [Alcanivorax sp.]|uniref:AraC family transcriptional regulator n=1 Tax=Alcanivorax sp. TaxID=1872427 RepID=UPI003A8CB3FD
MKVSIVEFPETKVASILHKGSPETEHDTVMKLVQWKIQNQYLDQTKHRNYGLHHIPEKFSKPADHRVDFCLSVDSEVAPNEFGIFDSTIPACRCALARDVGSRSNNQAVKYLINEWLPRSQERLSGEPIIFHYVNVGPNVKEDEAITDVYLPLQQQSEEQ